MEAGNRAKALVAGNFTLDGQDATEGSQQLVTSFNNYWDSAVYGLQLQLRFLFTNLFRAHQYEPGQLGSGSALQICGKVKEAKYKIEMEEILAFAEKIFQIDFEQVFRIPTIEGDETAPLRKRKREKRLEAFEVLKVAAYARVRSMEEEVTAEV